MNIVEVPQQDNEQQEVFSGLTGVPQVDASIWEDKQHLDIIKHYSQDDIVPRGLQNRQWSVFGKAFINTFLEETDMPMININFEILKINELMSKPPHLLTFQQVAEIDKMGLHMFLTARRAIGAKQGKMNERILQNTQISQAIGTQNITQKSSRQKILGLI